MRELALAFLESDWKKRDRVLIHCLNLIRSPQAWVLRFLSERDGNRNLPRPRWPLDAPESDEFDLLLAAIFHARPDLANFLLDHGARPDTCNSIGGTLLHAIAQQGVLDKHAGDLERLMDRLLHEGVGVDALDKRGRTALHWAVYLGNEKVCSYLLKRHAKLDLRDNDGRLAEAMPPMGGEPLAGKAAIDAYRLRLALPPALRAGRTRL